jgi:putative ABC transport system permease protein
VDNLPLRGNEGQGLEAAFSAAGASPSPRGVTRGARIAKVTANYFHVMGITLLRGRTFGPGDDSLAPRVAVVNRGFAEQYWPGQDPIGHQFGYMERDSNAITVVGIVGDVRDKALDQDPTPQAYFPAHQDSPWAIVALVARGTLSPAQLLKAMQRAVHDVNPAQAVYSVSMMNDVIGLSVAPRRTNAMLLMFFALLALVLAVLGVYSVVAYGVSQRTRELGIRAALGATGNNLLGLVARDIGWSALIGTIAGVAGAWALSRVLASFLYSVSAHDPATFVGVPGSLLLATAVATLLPALRVLRVNPAEVMRAD